jgi:hypothetical protein
VPAAGRRGRRAPQKKKGLPVGGLIGLLALVVVAAVAGVYLMGGGESAPEETLAAGGGTPTEEAVLEDVTEGTEAESATTEPVEEQAAATEDAALEVEPEAAGGATADADAPSEDAGSSKASANLTDPDSIDLSLIPDYGAIDGCSPGRFAELEELVATMIDPMSGAAGNRAKTKLIEAGKEAFPPILNALKTLDLTDDDQFRSADVCQKALQDICNGNNFGWKYPSQEPDRFHAYDKKAIRAWSQAWERAEKDDAYWAKLAKLDAAPEAPADQSDSIDEALDELDGLDDL